MRPGAPVDGFGDGGPMTRRVGTVPAGGNSGGSIGVISPCPSIGNVLAGGFSLLAVVDGPDALVPGDVVAALGVAEVRVDGAAPVSAGQPSLTARIRTGGASGEIVPSRTARAVFSEERLRAFPLSLAGSPASAWSATPGGDGAARAPRAPQTRWPG